MGVFKGERTTRLCACAAVLLAMAGAAAQTVGVERLVSETTPGHEADLNLEPAVAAVRDPATGNDEVVVAWNRRVDEENRNVCYRVSLACGAEWEALPQPLKAPGCAVGPSVDPIVAVSAATRDIWLGAAIDSGPIFVAFKPFRSSIPGTSVAIANCTPSGEGDKPLMAVGPLPGQTGSAETMYVTYENTFLLRCARSDDSPMVGTLWSRPVETITSNAGSGQQGNGSFPVIIPIGAGAAHAGGLVVGFSDNERYAPLVTSQPSGAVGSWTPASRIAAYSRPNGGGQIDNFPLTGVVFPSNIRVRSWPSLAVDPVSPAKVYMAFAGHAAGQPAYDSDLFVAISSDYGTTFPTVYRLTNQRLRISGDPNSTMEFMPSIAIDTAHGINLIFYRTTGGTPQPGLPAAVVVRYARFTDDSQLGQGTPFLRDLAGPFTPTYDLGDGDNEYHMIAPAGGCAMYAAYVRPDPNDPIPGRPKVYIRRIITSPPCAGDLDGNGVLNANDVLLFGRALAAGAPAADVNNDGVVDGRDVGEFFARYER
jgi:hypothetical protein